MSGTVLAGIDGNNPLGFLAGVGVQVAFLSASNTPCLWWSCDEARRHAVIDSAISTKAVADQAMGVFSDWKDSVAMNPRRLDGSKISEGDKLKLRPDEIRQYLQQVGNCGSAGLLMTSLVAEGSYAHNGRAKPTDLYFSAGPQKFLDTARKILGGVTKDDVVTALEGPWKYDSTIPSLGWDISDDPVYALRADKPGKGKSTNPGVEALALLGLGMHPVFGRRNRTKTRGCAGSWKRGTFSWPLWNVPASFVAVKSLLASGWLDSDRTTAQERKRWFESWGMFVLLQSPIRRSSQGGYGTFGPPEVIWQLGQ